MSRRSRRRSDERHLSLVEEVRVPSDDRPPPRPKRAKPRKRRKKSPRQWVAWAFKGVRKPVYKNAHTLHAYEESIILTDILALGGATDTMQMMAHRPGRYDLDYLRLALKRMHKQGQVKITTHTRFTRSLSVKVTNTELARKEARDAQTA